MPLVSPTAARVALALALSLGCGPVHPQLRPQAVAIARVERLAVVFADDGEFVVFDKQARATGTPAVLFGVVGAAVASGINQSEDAKTAASLRSFLASAACRDRFQASFEDALRAASRLTAQVVAEAPPPGAEGFDAVLEFRIQHCGFRLTNQSTGEMAAFIELGARLVLGDGSTAWDDRETVIATTRATLTRLGTEPDLVRSEFEGVLSDAGRRMANNLLYP